MYGTNDAFSDIEDIQFCDNTFGEAIAAKVAVKQIIVRLGSKQDELETALRELVTAADPATNMSDIVLRDALARAREALQ